MAVLAAAQFSPTFIWAANVAEVGFPDGLLAWILIVWAFGLLLWLLGVRLGLPPNGATAVVFWFLLGGSLLGLLADGVAGGSLTLLLMLVVFCGLVLRVHSGQGFKWVQTWVVAFVAISPVSMAIVSTFSMPNSQISSPETLDSLEFEDTRDVVLVVFDAHASYPVVAEFFPGEPQPQAEMIDATGAVMVPEMLSNYTLTHLSLTSAFEMGYPVLDGATIGDTEWSDMMKAVRGTNNLVDAFRSQGYRLVMVESGWAGFHCTSAADVCIGGPWPDEPAMLALQRTLLGSVATNRLREASARGAVQSARWLEAGLPSILENSQPDLVLAHLMLPHPPLRLDGECAYVDGPGLEGHTIAAPGMTEDEIEFRKAAYRNATLCAAKVFSDLARVVGDRAILVAFGDHGSDSRAQLHRLPEDWTKDEVTERLGVLFATNSDCTLDGVSSLVNMGRWLLSCLSNETIPYLEDRHFVAIESRRSVTAGPEPTREVTDLLSNRQAAQGSTRHADGSQTLCAGVIPELRSVRRPRIWGTPPPGLR